MIYRCILPDWAKEKYPNLKKVKEGEFNDEQLASFNSRGYHIYYLPNSVSIYDKSRTVEGSDIDVFKYVFVDCDLKDGVYEDKNHFLNVVSEFPLEPTKVVDSGNGIHVYWRVLDLDAMTYLKLQRRLTRHFITDEAVGKIFQLMRVYNTYNTKDPNHLKPCELLVENENKYTSEQLDASLPMLTPEDEEYCRMHFNMTYDLEDSLLKVNIEMPKKWGELLEVNKEVKAIWSGNVLDRSKADYRLGHILLASGFDKSEAMSVLIHTNKASERGPKGRLSYAEAIVDKIWIYEENGRQDLTDNLSSSVLEILSKGGDNLEGVRFPCYKWLDNTASGFRLGQVLGLVAGAGVGKTAIALNMFMGFVESNPDCEHFFVSLEQPANEIAARWKKMCGENIGLYSKVHVISNYDNEYNFRNLSLSTIQDYLVKFQKEHNKKIGCVVIDHIGILDTEGEDLIGVCKAMKSFAIRTQSFLIMQSQTNREKAGIGDLELNKDAAFGTVFFESYCDYLVTVWQPLKRCYKNKKCPTVTAFKFCKIRHKDQKEDITQEDTPYTMYFDPSTERLRELTQQEDTQVDFFNKNATNERKKDRKTDLVTYTSIKLTSTEKDKTK